MAGQAGRPSARDEVAELGSPDQRLVADLDVPEACARPLHQAKRIGQLGAPGEPQIDVCRLRLEVQEPFRRRPGRAVPERTVVRDLVRRRREDALNGRPHGVGDALHGGTDAGNSCGVEELMRCMPASCGSTRRGALEDE
jgi:hypothetical protein